RRRARVASCSPISGPGQTPMLPCARPARPTGGRSTSPGPARWSICADQRPRESGTDGLLTPTTVDDIAAEAGDDDQPAGRRVDDETPIPGRRDRLGPAADLPEAAPMARVDLGQY